MNRTPVGITMRVIDNPSFLGQTFGVELTYPTGNTRQFSFSSVRNRYTDELEQTAEEVMLSFLINMLDTGEKFVSNNN